MAPVHILLASASPRRSALLTQIGVSHLIRPVVVDESPKNGEPPLDYVLRLAKEKARALWDDLPAKQRLPVLAADTVVALDDLLFGKPRSRADGIAMLKRLAGRSHSVHSAVALIREGGLSVRVSSSRVSFRSIEYGELEQYWGTGEPEGKAGGYAIQGRAAIFVTHLEGSYSGVMGLPLYETWELLSSVIGPNQGKASS
jgi:septum formation protein